MPYKNKEKQREYQRKWTAKRRTDFFIDKTCVKCGGINNLQLDHIDRSDKVSHRIWTWSEERRQQEIAKCQILCIACHKAKTKLEFATPEPHGKESGYSKRKCRCDLCRKAHREYTREYRAKLKQSDT